MPRRPLRLPLLLCIFTGMCLSYTAPARVFLRWGAAKSTPDALESLGGTLAYDADIRINSGAGHVYVFGFEGGLNSHLPALHRHFGGDALAPNVSANTQMRIATLEQDAGVLRLVLIDLGYENKSVVFAMEQSTAAFEESGTPPDLGTLQHIGPLPQATPVFFARDERAGMTLVVQESGIAPAAMYATFATHLVADGWLPALPEGKRTPSDGDHFGLFIKAERTCIALSTLDPQSGMTRITVLHKEPGIE